MKVKKPVYRCAVNSNNVVVAESLDKSQTGEYAPNINWCDFTYTELPKVSAKLLSEVNSYEGSFFFKVENASLVCRTSSEINANNKGY